MIRITDYADAYKYLAEHSLEYGICAEGHRREFVISLRGFLHGAPWVKLLNVSYNDIDKLLRNEFSYLQRLLHEHYREYSSGGAKDITIQRPRASDIATPIQYSNDLPLNPQIVEPWVSNLG